jgi:alpha-tubulin suppressor-like RCC1 family protein
VQIEGLIDVKAIAAGSNVTFAIKNDGTLWALGGNGGGYLGTGTIEPYNITPVQVNGVNDVTAISTSRDCLALKSDGTVWAWGLNNYGQLGDGSFTKRITPVQVSGLSDVKTILSSESSHSVAITNDGKIWTWGWNNYGQLGDPSSISQRNTPSAIRDN